MDTSNPSNGGANRLLAIPVTHQPIQKNSTHPFHHIPITATPPSDKPIFFSKLQPEILNVIARHKLEHILLINQQQDELNRLGLFSPNDHPGGFLIDGNSSVQADANLKRVNAAISQLLANSMGSASSTSTYDLQGYAQPNPHISAPSSIPEEGALCHSVQPFSHAAQLDTKSRTSSPLADSKPAHQLNAPAYRLQPDRLEHTVLRDPPNNSDSYISKPITLDEPLVSPSGIIAPIDPRIANGPTTSASSSTRKRKLVRMGASTPTSTPSLHHSSPEKSWAAGYAKAMNDMTRSQTFKRPRTTNLGPSGSMQTGGQEMPAIDVDAD